MRRIEQTTRFKKDFKRELKGSHAATLNAILVEVLQLLISDGTLPRKYQDHALTGNWSQHRDCHLKPDLVLIYRLPDVDTVQLVRLGSHSQLSL